MTLLDLIYKTLKCLYKRDGYKKKSYSSFEVWSYLVNCFEEDFNQLGYSRDDFTHIDMDDEVRRHLCGLNVSQFRIYLSPDEDGLPVGEYWIP